MAQWGTERTFVRDGITLRVQAHVATDGFDPSSHHSIVDDLVLMTSYYGGGGDAADAVAAGEAAHDLLAKIKALYVGRPYSEWLDNTDKLVDPVKLDETNRGQVWEYAAQNLRRSYSNDHDRSYEGEFLARLGASGWELVTVVLDKRGDHIGYFKRRAIQKVRM